MKRKQKKGKDSKCMGVVKSMTYRDLAGMVADIGLTPK